MSNSPRDFNTMRLTGWSNWRAVVTLVRCVLVQADERLIGEDSRENGRRGICNGRDDSCKELCPTNEQELGGQLEINAASAKLFPFQHGWYHGVFSCLWD